MQSPEFVRIREFIRSELGISLGEEKSVLVRTRLRDVLARRGFGDADAYADWLIEMRDPEGLRELADAISTNHTFFWREAAHFEHLEKVALPEWTERLRARKAFDVRLWCAASATGEEPYTLGMLLDETVSEAGVPWKTGVLATDISQEALETARRGVYEESAVQKLPQRLVARYFEKADPGELEVGSRLKHAMTFRRLNLLSHPFPFRSKFHVVFCRNVMIYFDSDLRHRVADRIYDVMEEGAYLYLGLSETLDRGRTRFDFIAPGVFRKPAATETKGS